jgi:hypothetical protein
MIEIKRDEKGRFIKGNKSRLGCKYSEESLNRLSIAHKKQIPWTKGKAGTYSLNINYINNYDNIHKWIRYHKPKSEICEICLEKKYVELANISGEYKRDINDFKWLCKKCHMIFDNRIPTRLNHKKKKLEDLDYKGLHKRLRRKYKDNGICSFCNKNTNKLQLANLSGMNIPFIEDYIYLCRDCHREFDKEKGYNNKYNFIL